MEIISDAVRTTLESFNFAFCIIVNILTYIITMIATDIVRHKIGTWNKRGILFVSILSTGVLYYFIGEDTKCIINSAILAPVFWSWILKPLCKYFKVDYKDINNIYET